MRRVRYRLLCALLALAALCLPAAAARAAPWIGARGNHLVNGRGEQVRLLGVNRSGTEYSCQQGYGIFDGPSDVASVRAMRAWHINAVRLPLNETCWLGINGIAPALGGAAYRQRIHAYVGRLERAGLYVILDLHLAAPGSFQANRIVPLPDADHAPDFWRSVAATYREDRSVLFDLYNEPHDVGWDCWEHGCQIADRVVGSYRAAGMAELVAAVRSTGARQPVLLGGIGWARNLNRWLAHLPPDPVHAEVASNHTYNFAACLHDCRAHLARIGARHPVVTGELGEGDCRHRYIDPYMRWADRHGVSYLGWAWDAFGGWTCHSGPTLIKNYTGAPTAFGIGFREHLRASPASYANRMDDGQVLNRIDELVREEEALLHRHESEGLDPAERARLEELKVQLDQAWDYIRQRRALRQYGEDPDEASTRDADTVEGYGSVEEYDG